MSETMKLNLTKTAVFIGIIMTLASAVGGGYIAYDNAKSAKAQADVNSKAISSLETKQARFEGVIDERTQNTQADVKRIYDIVKEWER
jgi:Skp family chaperone for outer membrane proteins